MSIQTQAMLVNLTISQWTARKHDRRATQEVDQAHNARDAGRYNKLLVDKAALEPITKAANALRMLHYKFTLPWGDNGDRMLPAMLFMQYSDEIRIAKTVFTKAVDVFVRDYPVLIQDTRRRLGTLYDPTDYPAVTQIATRFGAHVGFAPIAAADDFRVSVGEEHVATIRAEITKQAEQRLNDATRECWNRVREVVERYAERMTDEKGRVFDSMVENARTLVTLLPALNVARDPELDAVAHDIERRLLPVTIKQLRSSASARQQVAEAANDIMAKIKWG